MVYILITFDQPIVKTYGPFGSEKDAGKYARKLGFKRYGSYDHYYLVRKLKRP